MYYFIVNPNSGGGKGFRVWRKMESVLSRSCVEYEAYFTHGAGDARIVAGELTEGSRDPRVIVVAGVNKIVKDLDQAIARVKTLAAPANGVRLGTGTPCSRLGCCAACDGRMTSGCASEKRMCCHYVVTGYQRTDRIRVVLVGEDLGY